MNEYVCKENDIVAFKKLDIECLIFMNKCATKIVSPIHKKLNPQCQASYLIIGHTSKAETSFPRLIEQSNILLCDCPGLFDN